MDIDTRITLINSQNRKRKSDDSDSPFKRSREQKTGCGDGGDDFIHFGSGMQLPFLPYLWTKVCPFCGKTGITSDRRRTMPLKFLGEYLQYACAKTPFVYNVLYQMAHYPELELQEVCVSSCQFPGDTDGDMSFDRHKSGRQSQRWLFHLIYGPGSVLVRSVSL